jgi:hypothetical protein
MNYDSYLENEEVCVDDIAKLLEVSRKSAIQRMARLVKRHQAVRLSMPTVGNPARFRLLVSKQSLLHTQKFAGPKMNREIDWKKFCSDPFGMTREVRNDELASGGWREAGNGEGSGHQAPPTHFEPGDRD